MDCCVPAIRLHDRSWEPGQRWKEGVEKEERKKRNAGIERCCDDVFLASGKSSSSLLLFLFFLMTLYLYLLFPEEGRRGGGEEGEEKGEQRTEHVLKMLWGLSGGSGSVLWSQHTVCFIGPGGPNPNPGGPRKGTFVLAEGNLSAQHRAPPPHGLPPTSLLLFIPAL